ncbi:MAG: gamma-glutamyltransferase family protein [Armatimonadetes bacterium]|jgi:gamma-glutamyltranspeptidase/glutathione hydrolase|nr:gamma-glutamyltransferase family protein [Armatimonadota bacterium]
MRRDSTGIGEPSQVFGTGREGFTTRPVITGRRGVVTAGHYLAAAAGMEILRAGGNAIDAGVAMGFCLAVLEPQSNGIGGESPMLIHHARTGRTVSINGQGTAPAAATLERFQKLGISLIPGDGLLAATVPSQVSNWIAALAEFGTMSLGEVLAPALDLARSGFAMTHGLRRCIVANQQRYREEWPGSATLYLPGGEAPQWGDRFCNPQWADTFDGLVRAEREAAGKGRAAGLEAARDVFYRGPIAERIAEFSRDERFTDASGRAHSGLLTYEDLGGYRTGIEAPTSVGYRGLEVHKCGPWSQGPVFLQQLTLLEGYDLAALGHNSPDFIHTSVECAKLAFADREYYYGDPAFVDVPMARLLSPEYTAERRALIDPERASLALRPGDVGPRPLKLILGDERSYDHDTTHLDAIDAEGNMMAATPSGGWIQSSPVIPGLGFPLGTRAQMFSLDPGHPNVVQPGKRPRTTLTPSLVTKDGRPWMVFGTPGGDQQDQWTLQFFLNVVDFGMSVQEALDAPTFHSQHFPSSFYPRAQHPGLVVVEGRIREPTREALRQRGHRVEATGDWANGRVLAIRTDPARGLIFGGASPRLETGYAIGW